MLERVCPFFPNTITHRSNNTHRFSCFPTSKLITSCPELELKLPLGIPMSWGHEENTKRGGHSDGWRFGAVRRARKPLLHGSQNSVHGTWGLPLRVSVCTACPMVKVTKNYINRGRITKEFTLLETKSLGHLIKQKFSTNWDKGNVR